MRTLIVGSTSVIGRALRSKLLSLGTVHTAGRREADFQLDLADWRTVPKTGGDYNTVIHVAADFGGCEDEDFLRAEIVNVAGALTACRMALSSGASHFVLLSTISASYTETSAYFGCYALSKRHAEEAARLFCTKRGITFTALRPSQVYDMAGECRRHQPLLYAMADHAENGEDIIVYGNNDAVRNYIYLDDVTEIITKVVEIKVGGTFSCAHPRSVRLSEVAGAAFAAFAKGGSLRFDVSKPNLADIPVENDPTLYNTIGFTPNIDIFEGMRRIRAYRDRLQFVENTTKTRGQVLQK